MSTTADLRAGATAGPQKPTHRRLLHHRHTAPPGKAEVDAVIVPAGRHASQLKPAAWLAENLGAPLVVLCSRDATAAEVRSMWGNDATVTAVDLRGRIRLPKMSTSTIISRTPFARDTDTPIKRNIALALTRMIGWKRILFLDDDIENVQPEATRRAASLLDDFQVVGLLNAGFPDNSVVCHANRDTEAFQSTFIGAGAMLFRGERSRSLFPDIYNEDWFFVLDGDTISSCAVAGRFEQQPFDPYRNPGRAGFEEFGDCLAEGIFALLDTGLTVRDADREFWVSFLRTRKALIEEIRSRLPKTEMSAFRRRQIDASLRAACASLDLITPELCTSYLNAWRDDCERWRGWVDNLPEYREIENALAHLGLFRSR